MHLHEVLHIDVGPLIAGSRHPAHQIEKKADEDQNSANLQTNLPVLFHNGTIFTQLLVVVRRQLHLTLSAQFHKRISASETDFSFRRVRRFTSLALLLLDCRWLGLDWRFRLALITLVIRTGWIRFTIYWLNDLFDRFCRFFLLLSVPHFRLCCDFIRDGLDGFGRIDFHLVSEISATKWGGN